MTISADYNKEKKVKLKNDHWTGKLEIICIKLRLNKLF